MEKFTKDYIFDAFNLILNNIYYALVPVLLCSLLYLLIYVPTPLEFYGRIAIYIAFVAVVPLLYGQFIEILETGQKNKWIVIYKKYWLKVFIVTLILRSPIILFILVFPNSDSIKSILSLAVDILTIYVLPLVLLSSITVNSIKTGVKCFLGNFNYNLPFIVILISIPIFSYIMNAYANHIDSQFTSYSSYIFLSFLIKFVDFLVFVSAAMILKDKLLKTSDV